MVIPDEDLRFLRIIYHHGQHFWQIFGDVIKEGKMLRLQ